MASNKNQHFVPKCHFKPFTHAGEGAAIHLYNWTSDRFVEAAPVKGQCAKDYFYGKALVIEKFLQDQEGAYATIIRKIVTQRELIDEADLNFLRRFAYLQLSRTEATIKRRSAAMQGMDDRAHKGQEKFRKESPILDQDYLTAVSIKLFFDTYKHVSDLEVLLIDNATRTPFVTSDDPAVLTNRLLAQRLGADTFGLVSVGLQLWLPLTPTIYLLCYDGSAYSVPNRRGIWLKLRKSEDVDAINELQFISCRSNIYFNDWAFSERIRQKFLSSADRRPSEWFRWWTGIRTAEDEHGELYRRATEEEAASRAPKIISHSAIYPVPAKWVREITFRPRVFGYENGSSVGLVREGQLAKMRPTSVPFRRTEVRFAPRREHHGPNTALLMKEGLKGE